MSVHTASAPTTVRGHRTSTATLVAGALFAVVPLLVELVTGDAVVLMGLALLMLLAALPGLHRLQGGRDGRVGAWGVRLTLLGILGVIVALVLGELSDRLGLLLAGVSAVSALAGVVAFSAGLSRAAVLSATGIWVFLGGMTLALASESFEQSLRGPVPWIADVLPPLGFVVAGVGLLVLGRSARRVEGQG